MGDENNLSKERKSNAFSGQAGVINQDPSQVMTDMYAQDQQHNMNMLQNVRYYSRPFGP